MMSFEQLRANVMARAYLADYPMPNRPKKRKLSSKQQKLLRALMALPEEERQKVLETLKSL